MFVLKSDITIGKFRFSGVNSITINRCIHSIVDTAIITIPSIAKIISDGKIAPGKIITGNQFNDGDPVIIRIGYNNELQTEFQGFVKRRNLKMPLAVECEGYSWLLRRNTIDRFWSSVKLKELLKVAVSNISGEHKISILCDIDLELNNVHVDKKSGLELIDLITQITDDTVSCFFIRPDTLWCGLVHSAYAAGTSMINNGTVNYRLGYNVIKDNSLKERTTESDPVKVSYSKRLSDGSKIAQTSDVFKKYAVTHSKVLNQIKDSGSLKKLANEKSRQINYTGYEGYINTFLQPYVEPGYEAYVEDSRYPERNGKYLVESIEVHFGVSGARRKVEIGPAISLANSI